MSKVPIRAIRVHKLQGMFDYKIEFPNFSDTIILIAPNGFGKTALLSLINACLSLRFQNIEEHTFDILEIEFEDKSRWVFSKLDPNNEEDRQRSRIMHRRGRLRKQRVSFDAYDVSGDKVHRDIAAIFEKIPPHVIVEAIDRFAPVSRISSEQYRTFDTDETITRSQIFEKYPEIVDAPEFHEFVRKFGYEVNVTGEKKYNSLFIETQRLLYDRKSDGGDGSREVKEEIVRQSAQLAKSLDVTYKKYAAISQTLDRSFPTRLIRRASETDFKDTAIIRNELSEIEAHRKRLTEAGILVEAGEQILPPDEMIQQVAQALAIYIDDSRQKLRTYDDIFAKVSAFKDLFNKKIYPKILSISPEGARVTRGNTVVPLEKLSSGEKHEFIMLYKLVFETPEDSLVLIDEPEISLHVAWQLEFMSDLRRIQSTSRFKSIIATHSPQIIQGEADIVIDLSEQMQ